eukprot:CAMPEP_0184488448 /NCGR_PEP_ID=MMETSP0113_2-20130426/11939_1 /TAXON_ID=91329 /ORGANISM="Norrisiella sphaerica, Strain BC52" /LENGTH=411 /DNA_ID=CAMNT_0026871233 /DNA_START=66 /DNA_END=1301 /DNA_ORIENTATION=-
MRTAFPRVNSFSRFRTLKLFPGKTRLSAHVTTAARRPHKPTHSKLEQSRKTFAGSRRGAHTWKHAPATKLDLRKIHEMHPELGELRFVSKIGKGGFGSVTLVRQRSTGLLYSIKIREDSDPCPRDLPLSDRMALLHPNVVRMLNSWQIGGHRVALFDFVRGPELRNLLHSVPKLLEENAPFYIAQLVLALQYLQHHRVIHRDLKPENVLMCEKGYLKVADFGLSVKDYDHVPTKLPSAAEFAGTISYSSPEMILSGEDRFTDWWALGVITYEILVGSHPFQDHPESSTAEVLMNVVTGDSVEIPQSLDARAASFLTGLLNRDPIGRMKFVASIKESPFFEDIEFSCIYDQRAKAPVIDLSNLREWKDKFILDRRGKSNRTEPKVRPTDSHPIGKANDQGNMQTMDSGILWG